MKIIFSCLIATSLLFSLTGCGNEEVGTESIDSISAETTTKESDSSTKGQSIFNGTVESIAETDSTTIQIKVVDVKATEDSENIGTSFSNDGVILNVSAEQLSDEEKEFNEGDQIEFKLAEKSVMTMSIPPQIPGSSIIEVSLIK